MSGLRGILEAERGSLALEASLHACFSGEEHQFQLTWSLGQAQLSLGPGEAPQILSLHRAREIAREIILAAERPEVLLGSRSTTSYQARLNWEYLSGEGVMQKGKLSFSSHEIPLQSLQEIFAREPARLAQLPLNLYTRASGLFFLLRELLSADAKESGV